MQNMIKQVKEKIKTATKEAEQQIQLFKKDKKHNNYNENDALQSLIDINESGVLAEPIFNFVRAIFKETMSYAEFDRNELFFDNMRNQIKKYNDNFPFKKYAVVRVVKNSNTTQVPIGVPILIISAYEHRGAFCDINKQQWQGVTLPVGIDKYTECTEEDMSLVMLHVEKFKNFAIEDKHKIDRKT